MRPIGPLRGKLNEIISFSQTSDLSVVFKESSPTVALIFVLSPGTDPAADLYKFADVMEFSKKMSAISLGQGQVRARPTLNPALS